MWTHRARARAPRLPEARFETLYAHRKQFIYDGLGRLTAPAPRLGRRLWSGSRYGGSGGSSGGGSVRRLRRRLRRRLGAAAQCGGGAAAQATAWAAAWMVVRGAEARGRTTASTLRGAAARCGDSVRRLGATAQATAQGTARAAARCGGSVRVLRRLLGAAAQATARAAARMVARGAETHKRETASSPRLPRVEPPPTSCAACRAGSCAWRATVAEFGGGGVWRRGNMEAAGGTGGGVVRDLAVGLCAQAPSLICRWKKRRDGPN